MNHPSHLLLAVVFLFVGLHTTAQNSVGIGTETPNPNAVLQLVSPDGNQGFLIPQLSTAQRTADAFISALSAEEDAGLLVFDTEDTLFYYWSGDVWTALSTQQLSAGTGLSIADGTINNTDDLDSQNEIQDLSLSGNDLTITDNSGATIIDLSIYMDNTDSQSLSLSGTSLSISGANSVDLSGLDGSGTDDQTATEVSVTPNGNIASTNVQDALLEIQSDVDAFVESDDQIASEVNVTSSGTLTSTDVQAALEELQTEIDGVIDTDDQTLSFDCNSISISEGNCSSEITGYNSK